MRSGLWAIAFVLSTHSDVALTNQASVIIIFITVLLLIIDLVEYFSNPFGGK